MKYKIYKNLEGIIGNIITDNKTPYCMATDVNGNIITDNYGIPDVFFTDFSNLFWKEMGEVTDRYEAKEGKKDAFRKIYLAGYDIVGMLKTKVGGKHRFTYLNENNELETKLFNEPLTRTRTRTPELVKTPSLALNQLSNDYIEELALNQLSDDYIGKTVDNWAHKYTMGIHTRLIHNVVYGIEEDPYLRSLARTLAKNGVEEAPYEEDLYSRNPAKNLLGRGFNHYLIVEFNEEVQPINFNCIDVGSIDLDPRGFVDERVLQFGGTKTKPDNQTFMIYAMT